MTLSRFLFLGLQGLVRGPAAGSVLREQRKEEKLLWSRFLLSTHKNGNNNSYINAHLLYIQYLI
jgi:hypothetical protein